MTSQTTKASDQGQNNGAPPLDPSLSRDPGSAPVEVRDDDGNVTMTINRGNPARAGMMEMAAQRRRDQLAPELVPEGSTEPELTAVDDDDDALSGYRSEPARPPTRVEPGASNPPQPAPAAPESHEPRMVQVKVYGQTYDVPEEEVNAAGGVAAYQMQAANEVLLQRQREQTEATQRALDEAKRLRDEAEARLQAINNGATAVTPAPGGEPHNEPEPQLTIGDDGLTDEQRLELEDMEGKYTPEFIDTRRVALSTQNAVQTRSGDVDTPTLVRETVQETLQAERNQRVAEEEEAARLETIAQANRQIGDANTHFTTHYSHIESDPDMAAVAKTRIAAARAEDPQRPLVEIVDEVGASMDKKFYGGTGALRVRTQRKRSTTRSPTPTAQARTVPPTPREAPAPPTRQQAVHNIIADRQKLRGIN